MLWPDMIRLESGSQLKHSAALFKGNNLRQKSNEMIMDDYNNNVIINTYITYVYTCVNTYIIYGSQF